MANYTLNFSNEDFIPSKKCFFIKRISNVEDETFLYYLEFFLEKYNFDGVVYVGEEIGEVLPEFFSQELWEKAVLMKVNTIGFFLSGEDITINNPLFKDRYLFIQNCETIKIEVKSVTFNGRSYPVESEKSVSLLEKMVKTLVENANKKASEWSLAFLLTNLDKVI